jgi:hypothetical protein
VNTNGHTAGLEPVDAGTATDHERRSAFWHLKTQAEGIGLQAAKLGSDQAAFVALDLAQTLAKEASAIGQRLARSESLDEEDSEQA